MEGGDREGPGQGCCGHRLGDRHGGQDCTVPRRGRRWEAQIHDSGPAAQLRKAGLDFFHENIVKTKYIITCAFNIQS